MGFNKKILSKAVSELGKAKAPGKPRDITVDPKGYWNPANQGQPVRVPGQGDPKGVDITMHNVNQPIWAQPNVGPGAIMYPEDNRHFSGASYVDETQIGRKGGTLKSKKYSKSMSATNKLFTKNKLFQNKKSKIFDPNAEFKTGGSKLGTINLNPNPLSHYELNYGFNLPTKQVGGNQTKLTPDEETEFQAFYSTLPENLQSDDSTYDIRGYWDSEGRPSKFNYDQPKEDDGYYYAYSINQNTGEYLKSPTHPTFQHAVDEDRKIGYRPVTNIQGRNIATENPSLIEPENEMQSFLRKTEGPSVYQDGGEADYEDLDLTDEEIQAYRDGGYIVEELPQAQLGKETEVHQTMPEVTITAKRKPNVNSSYYNDLVNKRGPGVVLGNYKTFNKPLISKQQTNVDKTFYLTDPRKIRATTGNVINPNVDLMGGDYNEAVVKNIINKSREIGIDPHTALAIALQESQFGKTDPNIGHDLMDENLNDPYRYLNTYKQKLDTAKKNKALTEAHQIQYYNGTGKIFPNTESGYHGYNMKKIYGVPVPSEGIDMMKNPLYGKQIIDLRDNVIKKSPYIDSLMNIKKQGGFVQHELIKAKGGRIIEPPIKGGPFKGIDPPAENVFKRPDNWNNIPQGVMTVYSHPDMINTALSLNTILSPDIYNKIKKTDSDALRRLQKGFWGIDPATGTMYTLPKEGLPTVPLPHNKMNYRDAIYDDKENLITDNDIIPKGYERENVLYTAGKNPKTGKVTEKEEFVYRPLPTRLNSMSFPEVKRPEQQIIPAPPYKKPVRYSGPRYGTQAGDENLNLPEGYTQEQREAARRKRDSDAFQQKNLKYQEQQRSNKPIVTRKQGGTLDKAQKGRTVTHTNRDDYNKAFAAEADSLSLYNDSRHAFNKFTRAGERFNTNLNPEQWQKASNEYDKLLDLQEKKWHTFPYKNGDVSQYIPGYTANYKYKGPRSGLIIKPIGVEKFYREGYDFPKFKKPVIHNIIQEPKDEVTPLKPISYQEFIRPEQQIIPAKPYVKPKHYRNWNPTGYHGENMEMPEGYTQQDVEKEIRKRQSTEYDKKALEYQEQEKAKINSRLKPASLTENFRQGGILDKAQYGEEFDYDYDKYKTAYYKSNTPNEEGEMPNTQVLPEVTVRPENIPDWLKYKMEFDKSHPYDQYLGQEHDKYKKRVNKKFANALGVNPNTLPEDREEEIKNDYEILRNNFITENLGKQKGYDPNKHREWVDHLSNKEREIASYSDYGKNLQPSLWAKTLAGSQELINAGVKATGIPSLLYGDPDKDVLNYKTSGLTNKEWNEIHNSGTGALETFSGLDAIGAAVANKLKNSRREQPGLFSGQLMGNVSPGDAAGLNPFLLSGVGEMMAGKSLVGVGANSLKSGAKSVGTALGKEQLMNNLSKSKNINQVVGSIKGVPPESALARLSPEELKAYRQVQEVSRMRATGKPVSQQYQWALDQGIPEEHLSRIFNKSKSEIESEIPFLKEREKSVETIKEKANQTRIDRTNELSNTTGTSGDDTIRHTLTDDEINNETIDIRRRLRDRTLTANDVRRNFDKTKKKTGLINALKSKVDNGLTSLMSEYPYYTGSVKENVPSLALNDKTSLKNVHNIVSNDSTVGVNAGDVFTGSLNTSHSSYLPQLKQTFKYNEGKPQFLGYQNMNNSGFLSGSRYSSDDIAKYLNTEIDEQIKRGIIPANIQRPYVKQVKQTKGRTLISNGRQDPKDYVYRGQVVLPQYGIKQGSNAAGKTIGAAEDVRNVNGTLNLNAGISPQLIKNFIGPKNKVGANLLNRAYFSPYFHKLTNTISPFNLIKGYGKSLEGVVKPLGNVIGKSIKDGHIVEPASLFGKKGVNRVVTTGLNERNASNVYAATFDGSVLGSQLRLGKANPQGFFSKTFRKPTYNLQDLTRQNLDKVDILDPGVEIWRKMPFSTKHASVNKQKLLNNEFQWSTTGAGLQNVAEKYGKSAVAGAAGAGAIGAYNYNYDNPYLYLPEADADVLMKENAVASPELIPSKAEIFGKTAASSIESPGHFLSDPYMIRTIGEQLQEEKDGGYVDSWEDDLDDEEIRLLEKGGYIVERL